MKINILLCDTFPGLLPAFIPSYVSMFQNLFYGVAELADYEVFPVMDDFLPGEIRSDEIYLVTGCNRSVYEDEKWISDLLRWIRRAVNEGAYLVGICFGHQAIAQALGGKVEKYAGGWGTGIRESVVVDDNLGKFFSGSRMHLLYNHHDQVVTLPEGARVLATSDFCRYEAFSVNNHVFAFQGHPEYTKDYELHLLSRHSESESEQVKRRAVESIGRYAHEGKSVADFHF